MNARSPVVPPAPVPPATNLGSLRLIWQMSRNLIGIWPGFAYDVPINRRRALGVTSLLLNDPAAIRQVLTANAARYRRPLPALRILEPFAGAGLLLQEGAGWRRHRRILAPLFSPKAVGSLIPHFKTAGEGLLARLAGRDRANLAVAFQDVTLDAVLRALFSLPASEMGQGLREQVAGYIKGPGRPSPFDAWARGRGDFAFALRGRRAFNRTWFAAVDRIIAERRASTAPLSRSDLLSLMLAARDENGNAALGAAEIRDNCATMLAAGFETTARLLFWASYLLTQDMDEQAAIRAEIAAFPPERVETLEDLGHWPRLRNTLFEALRLYPSAPIVVRDAVAADEILGEKVVPGMQVWISLWVLHRHRKFWDEPAAFKPERFAGKPASWSNEGAYMPFGAGPRTCIGASFAIAEAQLILAMLLSRYALTLDDRRPVMPVANFTIYPNIEPDFTLRPIDRQGGEAL